MNARVYTTVLGGVFFEGSWKALSVLEILGIDLKRDSLTSVMYAEALNSATSSVTLQGTDRHGILGQKPTHFQLSL
jgi:hypothetical protein